MQILAKLFIGKTTFFEQIEIQYFTPLVLIILNNGICLVKIASQLCSIIYLVMYYFSHYL